MIPFTTAIKKWSNLLSIKKTICLLFFEHNGLSSLLTIIACEWDPNLPEKDIHVLNWHFKNKALPLIWSVDQVISGSNGRIMPDLLIR